MVRTRQGAARIAGLCGILLGTAVGTAPAQQEAAVLGGIQYLRAQASNLGPGEAAMAALAMIKAEVPPSDPALAGCLAKVRSRFTQTEYAPVRGSGQGGYEAGATAMALASLDPIAHRPQLTLIVNYLLATQNPNGSWDYAGRTVGDTSITQYAVLGLWESENSGVPVPPAVWERIASWIMSTQFSDGGWIYHKDEAATYPETVAMTTAAVGSLLICHRQLEPYRPDRRGTSPLLAALSTDSGSDFKPTISFQDIEQSVRRGMSWISAHFTTSPPTAGQTPYYMLYGVERMGALADRQTIGRLDWFDKGREFIRRTQKPDGSWEGQHSAEMNTCWAILFLTKSTAKTLKRIQIKKLGAGTLLGGRGLPKDLNSMTIAGGRVVSRPMNGAIEGMLAVLEDPRAQQADAAAAGLVDRYYREGPDALRPFKPRLRKMLADRDPGVRRVAAWALAHTGDMDIVPSLIEALTDPDEEVVDAARLGLQIISRKVDGLGPPSPSTPEQRKEAAARWRDWFNAIKPLDLDEEDRTPLADGEAGRPATPPPAPAAPPATVGRTTP